MDYADQLTVCLRSQGLFRHASFLKGGRPPTITKMFKERMEC